MKTDSNTGFSANARGAASGLAKIAVGDVISFSGTLDQNVSGLTVSAKQVKDWTEAAQPKTKKAYDGIVTAINATLGSFIIEKNGATSSIETTSSTTFTKNGVAASFSDLLLNAKVKITGVLNASSTATIASAVDIVTNGNSGSNDGIKLGFNGWFNWNPWLKLWHK